LCIVLLVVVTTGKSLRQEIEIVTRDEEQKNIIFSEMRNNVAPKVKCGRSGSFLLGLFTFGAVRTTCTKRGAALQCPMRHYDDTVLYCTVL
jgi:hypothetical protein